MSTVYEEQSEDGELMQSPSEHPHQAKPTEMDFSFSEDDGENMDSLDIKPPQAQVSVPAARSKRKEERSGHKRTDKHRGEHRTEDRSHSHRSKHHRKEREHYNREKERYYKGKQQQQLFEQQQPQPQVSYHVVEQVPPERGERREIVKKEPAARIKHAESRKHDEKKLKEREQRHSDPKSSHRARERLEETKREKTHVDRTLQDLRERLLSKRTKSDDEYRSESKETTAHGGKEKRYNKESFENALEGEAGLLVKEIINISTGEDRKHRKEERHAGGREDDITEEEQAEKEVRRKRLLVAEREISRQKEQSRLERERRYLEDRERHLLEASRPKRSRVDHSVTVTTTAVTTTTSAEIAEDDDSNVVMVSDNSEVEEDDEEEDVVTEVVVEGDDEGGVGEEEEEEVEYLEEKRERRRGGEDKSERSEEGSEGETSSNQSKGGGGGGGSRRSLRRSSGESAENSPISDRSDQRSRTRSPHSNRSRSPSPKSNGNTEKKSPSPEVEPKNKIDDGLPPYYPAIQGCRPVEEFQCLNRIEEGTYGVVYRAQDKRTEEIVALKKLKMEKEKEGFPITSLREINTLLKGQHPNIVTVREIVVGSHMDKIFIVMDYVEHDLKSLMETMRHKKQMFTAGEVKCLLRQLLSAVAHLHDNWILHRDLKTSNLLLSHKGILKVGDFGLAREYGSPIKPYTPIVVTLWYRAPELLLCTKVYSTPIDIWSVGCIFAELLLMNALFPGKSEVDQLNRIFQDLGTPNEKIWPGFKDLPAVQKMKFAEYPVSNLRARFTMLTEVGQSLLGAFLTYDPTARSTAEKALEHAYFTEAPLPVDPAMFPTWPAKSELGHKRALAASPKPPSGGREYKQQLGGDGDDNGYGFRIGISVADNRRLANAGGGFSLKF